MTNLAELLGDWGVREGPLYQRLAAAIAAAIESGRLGRGTMLAPERSLAARLAIGRSTVVAAYERLRHDGLVLSRQGSGTWVAGASPHRADASGTGPAALVPAAFGSADLVVDLATAALPAPPVLREVLADLGEADLDVLDTAGYSPAGLPRLRAALARYLSELGLPTGPDQVLVTTGDQQALWLLCHYLLADGGEAVVEDPTSPGILDVLRTLPATIRAASPLAGRGGATELATAARRADARLVYVIATVNPEGAVASRAARRALLDAVTGDTRIVEDLSTVDLTFAPPPPPLAALGGDNERVVTVGSMSKLFWGGLRVGFVRAAPVLVGRLTHLKARVDLGTPMLSQVVCARLLDTVDATRADRHEQLRGQLAHALHTLGHRLPDVTVAPPAGGLSLWLRLPTGTGGGLTDVAARFGVAVVPGSLLSHRGAGDDCVRIAYARDRRTFDEGAARLGAAWRTYRDQVGAGTSTGGPILI